MTEERQPPRDDELDELLGLVDGDLELPPGQEDRILAEVLATASTPQVMDEGVAVPVSGEPSRARGRWLRPALVVAAMLAVGGVLVGPALLDRGPELPPVLSSDDATVEPAGLSVAALCERTDLAAAELELESGAATVGPEQRFAAADLSLLLAELVDRSDADDPTEVVDTLRTGALLADLLHADLARERPEAASRTRRELHDALSPLLPISDTAPCAPAA